MEEIFAPMVNEHVHAHASVIGDIFFVPTYVTSVPALTSAIIVADADAVVQNDPEAPQLRIFVTSKLRKNIHNFIV